MNKRKTTHNEKKEGQWIKGSSEFDKKDNIEENETKENRSATEFSELSASSDRSDKIIEKENNLSDTEKKVEDISNLSDNEDDDEKNEGKIEKDENEDPSADGEAIEEKPDEKPALTSPEPSAKESLPTGQAGSGVVKPAVAEGFGEAKPSSAKSASRLGFGEAKEEFVGEAMFQKGTNSKKNLALIIVIVVVIALVLFARTNEGKNILTTLGFDGEPTVLEKYINPIHKYAFEFKSDKNPQLVVAGNIPAELRSKGVESMQDLDLTDGDALLVRTDTISGNNIVYTVLELSKREGYITLDGYLESLRVDLSNTTQSAGTKYVEKGSTAGKEKLPAVEFSFKMDVLTDQEKMETRVWVFYDTIFETDNNAYRISFGYPKDIKKAQYYIDVYYDMVASFTYNEGIDEDTDEKEDHVSDDHKEAETETIPEEDEIEIKIVE